MAYGHKTEHRLRVRAQIVLHAARGRSNARIAHETGLHLDTVRAWRGRFAHGGLLALADRKRSGRPTRFTPVQVAEAKALACQLPAETGVPLSRWSCPELAAELTRARDHRDRLRVYRAPLAARGCAQALAVPVLDLHPRPGLPRQGPACPGPVCPHVRGCPAGPG
ncbi:helix-turn-helix domain-containing protein [Streptomyces turgidiscabies]|nr:helix-turn-helix domain-containing protein [Streptomyces turgidiscabies]